MKLPTWISDFQPAIWAGVLATASSPSLLCAQETTFRSSAEPRRWLTDERQLPRYSERATHRGFEVHTGQIVVIATTSLEDARQAAEQATQAWSEALALADHWTTVHRQPNFAQGAVQVVLDGDRAGESENSPPVLARIGRVTQVLVNASRAQEAHDEQQKALRQAVAVAFFQTAELDQKLPPWTSQGLAAYIGGSESGSDKDDEPAALVRFLMEGYDGRHAGPFFDLLREHLASTQPDPDRNYKLRNGSQPAATPANEPLNQFVETLTNEFEQWKLDPQLGQPLHVPDDAADDGLRQAQQELLLVLKLAERFASAGNASIRAKVTMFENGRSSNVPLSRQSAAPRPLSPQMLLAKMSVEEGESWATLGLDGKLIWNHDQEKLRKLLGVDDQRYRQAWQNDRWVLQTQLADGRQLAGWLEPNPKIPQRPLAKFSVVQVR